MRIIQPSFEIWERDEQRGGLAIIERAGRLCYKSEAGQTPDSAEKFTRGLIRRHHNSVLEHGDMIFEVGLDVYDALRQIKNWQEDAGEPVPMLSMTNIGGRCIVSGNIRAWRELFALGFGINRYFIRHFDPVFVEGYGFKLEELCEVHVFDVVRQIHYKDLHERNEKLVHVRETVHFLCDRAVQNEFVRHRTMSFSVESSRFCDYSSDRFEGSLAVVEPPFFQPDSVEYNNWEDACRDAELSYWNLRMQHRAAQEARTVLPLSVKTEMAVTGNLRAWNHFFDLRARQVTGPAHPQAVELAAPLMEAMTVKHPDVFGVDD